MPTYRVEPYFEQALLSVVDQTLRDIEIIPVDDGSPDNCGAIMDAYATKDPRIKPIHQPNGGYGKAINAGLYAATGEYIAIVETDDWIEPDMLETLYSAAKKGDHPIVKGSFYKHEAGRGPYVCGMKHITGGREEYACPANDLHLVIFESSIWTALYRRDFIEMNGLVMLETTGAAYQDVVWKFSVYSLLDTVLLIDKPVYHYRVMAQGSSSASSTKANAMFVNYKFIRDFLEKHGSFERFKDGYYAHQFLDLVFHSKRLKGEALEEFRNKARTMISEATEIGISLNGLRFHPDVNDYVQREVKPVWDWVLEKTTHPQTSSLPPLTYEASPTSLRFKVKRRIKDVLIRWVRKPFFALFLKPLAHQLDAISWEAGNHAKALASQGEALASLHNVVDKTHRKLDVLLAGARKEMTDSLYAKVITHPSGQFAYYLRANRDILPKRIERLKSGMDEASCFQVDRYFKLFSLLPQMTKTEETYIFPLSMDIFSDEERFILANKEVLLAKMREAYANLDMSEVPIGFNNMYFECGVQLVPYRLTEKFAGTIALDCGAWVGDSAIPLARYGFKEVHSFEPIPETYTILKRNIEKNNLGKWIKPHQCAVDAERGTLNFLNIGKDGQGSLASVNGTVKCHCVTIDDFCKKLEQPVGLIKLDIEGREVPALHGAVDTIKKYKPVLLVSVYHTWVDPEQIFTAKEFIENLNLGYEFQFKWMQPEISMIYEYILVCYCKDRIK